MKNTIIFGVALSTFVALFALATLTAFSTALVILIIVAMIIAIGAFHMFKVEGNLAAFAGGSVVFLVGMFIGSILLASVFSWGLFTDSTRVEVAQISTEELNASKSAEEAQVVNLEMATALANKAIGVKRNGTPVSTQFELDIDNASLQKVKGQLQWVFPLKHHSIVKAFQAPVVPVFVMVSATQGDKAPVVVDGKYKISSTGWFSNNLDRNAWNLTGYGFFTTHFEVDENLKPHWVIAEYKHVTVFAAPYVKSVVVLDGNGNVVTRGNQEKVAKTASWIDEMFSASLAKTRASDIGAFEGGWFNQSMFGSGAAVSELTANPEPAFLRGKKYYVASMTSISGADNSSTGLILIDARTGVSTKVDIVGMSEDGAIKTAEAGLGAEAMRWVAMNAQPIQIDGNWYWAVSIAAKGTGLFERAAIVKMSDASVCTYGESFSEAAEKLKAPKKGSVEAKGSPKERLKVIRQKMADLQKEMDSILSEM